jgi:chromatin remodeling complex protein RSC6
MPANANIEDSPSAIASSSVITAKDKSGVNDIKDKLDAIRDKLKRNAGMAKKVYQEQKELLNELKELNTLYTKTSKVKSKRILSGNHAGFNSLQLVPEPLCELLDIPDDQKMMTRPKVTNLLYEYFGKNNMLDQTSKRNINPNKAVRKIFGMKKTDEMNFYNLQTWLADLYKKYYPESENDNEDIPQGLILEAGF